MTTLDLEPIKERLAAATPGPWRVWHDPDPSKVRSTAVETAWCYGDIEGDTELITDYLPTGADAEMIANAPEDIAALISEVERLREQVEAVKVAVSNHPNPCELYDDPDDDEDSLPVSCGWKNAYQDVLKALEVGE